MTTERNIIATPKAEKTVAVSPKRIGPMIEAVAVSRNINTDTVPMSRPFKPLEYR